MLARKPFVTSCLNWASGLIPDLTSLALVGLEIVQFKNPVIENMITESKDHNNLRALLVIFLGSEMLIMVGSTADCPLRACMSAVCFECAILCQQDQECCSRVSWDDIMEFVYWQNLRDQKVKIVHCKL